MLKGTIKKFFVTIISVILLILIIPFNYIKAENQTYYVYDYNYTETIGNNVYYGYNINNLYSQHYYYFQSNTDYQLPEARGNVFKAGSNYYLVIMVDSLASNVSNLNLRGFNTSNNSVYITGTASKFTSNNKAGWYSNMLSSNDVIYYIDLETNTSNMNTLKQLFYDYLFGDNSIDPAPDVDYGNVTDVKFNTSFVSNNQQSYIQICPHNKDNISWNVAVSDNGTQLYSTELLGYDWEVEIRAVMFNYGDETKQSLLLQQLQDMNIMTDRIVELGTYPLKQGAISYEWGQVATAFASFENYSDFFNKLRVTLYGNRYMVYGWYYEIRLLYTHENYASNWKIIYNTTALPSTSDPIMTNYYDTYNYNYNYNIQNTYQTINEMNGNNSIYYLNSDVVYYNQTNDNTYNNNVVNNFSEIVNEVKEKEDDFNQTLDENLTDINLNEFDITQWGNSFQNSAEWVKTQFNRMTIDTPIGNYLGFSLVVGLGLLIIGRIFK